jgi:LmbE family N-acetylglucosaminyl deacetylase
MSELQPKSKAMVVVAHPDDAEYGCSASVAKWTRLGHKVVYVICTDGSKGTSDRSLKPHEISQIRKSEQAAACAVLGVSELEFLDYPDGYLEPTLDLRRDIARQIRKHRPEIVVTTYPLRNLNMSSYASHPDHIAAGEATLAAIYPTARDHLSFPELMDEGFSPWAVTEAWVLLYAEGDSFNPVEEADINRSIQALLEHKSQISAERLPIVKEFMRERRAELGAQAGATYAEAFKRFQYE